MNNGTKIRTILGVLTTINTMLAVTDVTQFGNETLNLYYKVVSVVLNALIIGINTYFNNDYTEEACVGTGEMRYLKMMSKDQDEFYTEPEEVEEGEEENDQEK